MQTSLVRSSEAARTVLDQSPPAGVIASRNGSATVAPSPRNTVRRGICFPVMNDIDVSPRLNSQLSTLNSQLSTLNSQLSTLNSQLSIVIGVAIQTRDSRIET